jgi:hypothetical protein
MTKVLCPGLADRWLGLGDVVSYVNFCIEGQGHLRSVVREFGGSVVPQSSVLTLPADSSFVIRHS